MKSAKFIEDGEPAKFGLRRHPTQANVIEFAFNREVRWLLLDTTQAQQIGEALLKLVGEIEIEEAGKFDA